MIYDNVHQLKAKLAAQQTDFAKSKHKGCSTSGLEFQQQMEAKQIAMQASNLKKAEEKSSEKDARATAGSKFEAFLNSYVTSNHKSSLLS